VARPSPRQVHTGSLKELPPRFEKQFLKDFAQMDERYLLARATQQVSILTEGILAMEATLLGIVEADPKKLLQVPFPYPKPVSWSNLGGLAGARAEQSVFWI